MRLRLKVRSRAVVANADALRVPLGFGARILAPRLTTVTRKVNADRELILADNAVRADEIDAAAAEEARRQAEAA